MSVLTFHLITIFPNFFDGPLSHGIVGQAQKKKKISIQIHDLRGFTQDRHKTVDDRPFGGGEGMILKPEPIFRAVEKIYGIGSGIDRNVILLSPQGRKFNQEIAFELSMCQRMTLICGRYEGVDQRVREYLTDDEISIGDYVLSGGELAACVLLDAVTRLVPGVLNKDSSRLNESFTIRNLSGSENHQSYTILDHPHYTRPENFDGLKVPELLMSGDHKKIGLWRRKKGIEKTLKNRPDLLQYDHLSEADKRLLELKLEP
jgi:tRNA (guanine37-N1)-methyltransferase